MMERPVGGSEGLASLPIRLPGGPLKMAAAGFFTERRRWVARGITRTGVSVLADGKKGSVRFDGHFPRRWGKGKGECRCPYFRENFSLRAIPSRTGRDSLRRIRLPGREAPSRRIRLPPLLR
nr:hypothetical protein [Bacillaceae bacterium]